MKWITRLTLAVCLSAGAFAQTPAPRAASDFQIVDSSGKDWKISDLHGKVVVMQFLYTTCSHCQATARMLSTLEREFGPRGLQVIGVAFNPEAQQTGVIADFTRANEVAFPIGAASLDSTLRYLGISVMERFVVPQIVVIDRHGMIRAQSQPLGTPELQDETYLRSMLSGLLKDAPATTRTRR